MPGGKGGGGGRDRKPPSREVTVSKALSFLLRHGAEKEGLKIDSRGYANVADVLAWRKLKSLKVTFPEIISAVEASDKKRFALCYFPPSDAHTDAPLPPANLEESSTSTPAEPSPSTEAEPDSATITATALLSTKSDLEPTHYLIRATQGHSIKSVEAESGLLERLSLDNPDKLPGTVVHGTYHSTWPVILKSRGLRAMGRNHAHFATGPALDDVLGNINVSGRDETEEGQGNEKGKAKGKEDSGPESSGKVISGMRGDAQVLIYLDIKRALAGGVPFWRSENGVILSEGVNLDIGAGPDGGGVIPVEYFDVVVERKKGFGKIWEGGKVLQELPEELTRRGNPKGRGKR
ncbi:tRNA 2'-phosphotransferase [Aspergillus undulatus]|uniref:tRNA 2'-phosphotransferase n=1 Tax=Aspergillus undulatus TaxID=1810928 RepID=UPI003CCCC977